MAGSGPEIDGEIVAISDPGERGREAHIWGDRLVINFGNVVAWAFPLLMAMIVAQVTLRKFGFNQAWLDDAQWWVYGFAMLTGFGYAITTDSHVRVDIFHAHYSPAKKAKVELFGLGWLLFPFLILMTDVLFHYAWSSILAREGSDSPNGLHGLFILKATLPVLFVLAIIAALSVVHRNLKVLTQPKLWSMVVATLPGAIFAAERATHYVLWWAVRLTNSEIRDKRIAREPIFDWTLWISVALVAVVIVVGYARHRSNRAEG